MVTYEEIFAKIEAYIKKADPTKERKVPHTFLFKITKDGAVVKYYCEFFCLIFKLKKF